MEKTTVNIVLTSKGNSSKDSGRTHMQNCSPPKDTKLKLHTSTVSYNHRHHPVQHFWRHEDRAIQSCHASLLFSHTVPGHLLLRLILFSLPHVMQVQPDSECSLVFAYCAKRIAYYSNLSQQHWSQQSHLFAGINIALNDAQTLEVQIFFNRKLILAHPA